MYCPLVLFIMLYKVVLTFECVDKILKCDQSNERFRSVLSGTANDAVHGGINFFLVNCLAVLMIVL